MTIDPSIDGRWSKVVTVPELPVQHDTTLTLNCKEGYTNLGGNTAVCRNREVVPTAALPNCRCESNIQYFSILSFKI